MANQPAQTLKGIGKDVPPHIANPVTADAGKHEESYPQAAPRLTQSPWTPLVTVPGRAAPWCDSADHLCYHRAGPFPNSLADMHLLLRSLLV